MQINNDKRQKAWAISKAIQAYMEQQRVSHLRSTDLYDMLANKGLIEKDIYEPKGLWFRKFLRELKDCNCLSLIPQCRCIVRDDRTYEWHFHRLPSEQLQKKPNENLPHVFIPPSGGPSRQEITDLLQAYRPMIDRLPKKTESGVEFNSQERETRDKYKRAYENWTEEEYGYMKEVYEKTRKIDAVAELLQRQPHVVEQRLRERGLLKPPAAGPR